MSDDDEGSAAGPKTQKTKQTQPAAVSKVQR